MNLKRILLIAVGLGFLVGGITAYILWNKPHRDVESEKGIAITADALVAAYNADEKAADAQYLNKAIEVSGTVAKAENNQDGQTTVLFASSDAMTSVFCTMRDKGVSVNNGAAIVIKGICTGHTLTDVTLTDCVVVK